MIVKDGEGATKFIKLKITCSIGLAQKIARKISNSLLVKTAMYGSDPNWGRIVASIGSVDSKDIHPNKISLKINNILCFKNGNAIDNGTAKLKKSMTKNAIELSIDLNNGKFDQVIYFSDLSHDYVNINSEYTS